MVGLLEPLSEPTNIDLLISAGLSIRGSAIGGIGETAEMLAFCAEHGIRPDIQLVRAGDLTAVFEILRAGGPSSRYVLEIER
ncbi:hypothetical protein C3L29_041365 [Pseudomonas sp. MWU12-2534b]|nr:hypothetical protein C3L29_041365 [Pseudomonas sp. MWU12-2534b]